MPIRWIDDPEEWERKTGSRGSVYIGVPVKRPPQRWREPERDIEMTEDM
jgi:hypothetical protein